MLLLNRAPTALAMSATWEQLGIGAVGERFAVYDVLRQMAAGTARDAYHATVPSHDVAFVILSRSS